MFIRAIITILLLASPAAAYVMAFPGDSYSCEVAN